MGLFGSAGLKSGFSLASLLLQDIVARSISLTQTSGNVAVQLVTGARLKLGTGTKDFVTSDGADTAVFNGGLSTGGNNLIVSPTVAGGGSFGSSLCGIVLTPNATNIYGSSALTLNHKTTFAADAAFSSFSDGSGTTGNQTLNFVRGICAIAAAGSAVTIGNSFVTATSTVLCVLQTNDATARLANVVPGSGTFTINLTAAATGTTKIAFIVLN